MDIEREIKDYLRQGSVNRPGEKAADIIASGLGLGKNSKAVTKALESMSRKGEVDLGGAKPASTSFVSLTQREYRPSSPEGRRQSKYAVDQQKRRYKSRAIATPPVTRQATLEEWIRMGNNPDDYPFREEKSSPKQRRDIKPPKTKLSDAELLRIIKAEGDEEGFVNRQMVINLGPIRFGVDEEVIATMLNKLLHSKKLMQKTVGRQTYVAVKGRK